MFTFVFKIKWNKRLKEDNGSACKVSVDGTDFKVAQIKPFWKGWYSHKFKGPGLRYEVGVSIQCGDIVWINGPFPCGAWPDIKIFRQALKGKLISAGERVEADDGYRGEPRCVDLPKEMAFGFPDQLSKKAALRHRHETVNSRFKNFSILKDTFRSHFIKHGDVFRTIVVLTQLNIKYEDPLWKISGYQTLTHEMATKLLEKQRRRRNRNHR